MTTIQSTIQTASQQLQKTSDSPCLDAELLLALVIGKNRTYLRTWPEQEINPQQIEHFQALLDQRRQGHPIAYLLGYREFWSREFIVSPAVLIPRPETELLVELVLEKIPKNQPCTILDLGTGSGAIALTLAAERPQCSVTATDNSPNALAVAIRNAEHLKINNVHFTLSHWFEQLDLFDVDIIVSNPPYIAPNDPHLNQGDVRFEPDPALISDDQGLQDITIIADQARKYIKPGGILCLEHGYNQQSAVQAILKNFNYANIQTLQDFSGLPRVTSASWFN